MTAALGHPGAAEVPRRPHGPEVPPALVHALVGFAARSQVVVALDFDGTISPLTDDPAASRPLPGASRAMTALAEDPGVRLTLVSGRPVGDLNRLASPPSGTLLIGSHGAESGRATTPGEMVVDAVPLSVRESTLHRRLGTELDAIAGPRPGVWVETKAFSVTLHTRLASPSDAEEATALALAGAATWPGVHPLAGKDVVELAVRSVTKGDAVRHLRSASSAVPILYAGDDVTDERALAALRAGDLGVKVGRGTTLAAHRVASPEALVAALDVLVGLRRRRRGLAHPAHDARPTAPEPPAHS